MKYFSPACSKVRLVFAMLPQNITCMKEISQYRSHFELPHPLIKKEFQPPPQTRFYTSSTPVGTLQADIKHISSQQPNAQKFRQNLVQFMMTVVLFMIPEVILPFRREIHTSHSFDM